MKKPVLMALVGLLLISVLSGCAPRTKLSPDEPTTLTMWHVYGEQADSPMNRLVEEFNATVGQEKGVLVAVTNVTSTSKIGEQLKTAAAGGPGAPDLPDLFSAHSNTAATMDAETLLDWEKYFSKEELAQFVPEFLEDGRMDGRLTVFHISLSLIHISTNGHVHIQAAVVVHHAEGHRAGRAVLIADQLLWIEKIHALILARLTTEGKALKTFPQHRPEFIAAEFTVEQTGFGVQIKRIRAWFGAEIHDLTRIHDHHALTVRHGNDRPL